MNDPRHVLLADGNWLHVCATTTASPDTADLTDAAARRATVDDLRTMIERETE